MFIIYWYCCFTHWTIKIILSINQFFFYSIFSNTNKLFTNWTIVGIHFIVIVYFFHIINPHKLIIKNIVQRIPCSIAPITLYCEKLKIASVPSAIIQRKYPIRLCLVTRICPIKQAIIGIYNKSFIIIFALSDWAIWSLLNIT